MRSGAMTGSATMQAMRRFGEMLDAVCPRHRKHKQPLALEPDAPRALADFFEAVGFSEAVGAGGAQPQQWRPTREASQEWLRRTFETLFGEDVEVRDTWGVERDDFSAAWKRLPATFRILHPRGPLLTDESSPAEDPPLLELQLATGTLKPLPERAVAHLIRATWSRVMSGRSAGVVNLRAEGEQVLEPVFPGLYRLAEGIWGLDSGPGAAANAQGKLRRLFFDDFERYIDFVLGQPDERLPHFFEPEGPLFVLQPNQTLDPEHVNEPGFRRFTSRSEGLIVKDWFQAVGRIEGMGVWLQRTQHDRSVDLVVAPRNLEPMRTWLQRNGLELELEVETQPDIWSEPVT
ncbi:hypothetical protein [Corallococcus exiguus]|uniref:hypothetical protein n=1 Tax=Corallococcus exiguus TaxID=83462 RepID=UPI00156108D5|nr:hypothetical protein [Corallococcus exiguus]NRD51795.1 hypothetical protein [Corallococcus exiguus]